jgi:hypothetical protein
MERKLRLVLSALILLTAACEKGDGGSAAPDDDAEDPSTTTGDPGPTTVVPTTTTTVTPPDMGAADDGQDDGMFIVMNDGAGPAVECDVWQEGDCPEGQKCMPYANDGGSSWNATKCVDVVDNPGQTGDVCTVEGSGVSGIDTCDNRNMCYYVDSETQEGICVSFCQGSQESPTCDPNFICTIVNEGVLTLCRPTCDPILQNCEGEALCLQATGSDGFTCIIDASGDVGAVGDNCAYINDCDMGHFCADATAVPGCTESCCSAFCDLTAEDPLAGCLPEQECQPWFETTVPGLEHVGACAVPQQ